MSVAKVKATLKSKTFHSDAHPLYGLKEYWRYRFENVSERMQTVIMITKEAHDDLGEKFCDDYAKHTAEGKFMRAKYKGVEA